ncbi:MAG: hypothetical protein KTR21_12080 [Rhodobacteraceae bacterium]|nr:hypothetical protein [Paracoccaceae bacterium]
MAWAALWLSGCAVAGVELAYVIQDEKIYQENIDSAHAGDAVAQYHVGKSLCCSFAEEDDGYYNTRRAITWLCASAQQGHGPAMHALGDIYAGQPFEDTRFVRQAMVDPGGGRVSLAMAYVWYQHAIAHGAPEAGIEAHRLRTELTQQEALIAKAQLEIEGVTPCEWDEVMSGAYVRHPKPRSPTPLPASER